jgi:uncharacterized LabA/DUF88 family protein
MSQRTIVFIDSQNTYKGARETFFIPEGAVVPHGPGYHGQFHPLKIGELLVSRHPVGVSADRTLVEVRIYTGRPDPRRDGKTSSAHMRQCTEWERSGVTIIHRPLRYPYGWPERSQPGEQLEEKGIDVALAVDFVTMAVDGKYDVGIIFSTDTDLCPAIEYVLNMKDVSPEVAAWRGSYDHGLKIAGQHLWCHRLTKADYVAVSDYRDYNLAR